MLHAHQQHQLLLALCDRCMQSIYWSDLYNVAAGFRLDCPLRHQLRASISYHTIRCVLHPPCTVAMAAPNNAVVLEGRDVTCEDSIGPLAQLLQCHLHWHSRTSEQTAPIARAPYRRSNLFACALLLLTG